MGLKFSIGSKTCSPPLFHSKFLHFCSLVINFIPKNISDISQKCPIRRLTLNLLPFVPFPIMPMISIYAVSGSTRFGLFAMKPKCLKSMFASFRRVACLFTIYSSGICMCTKGRRTGQVGGRRDLKYRLCLGALSQYDDDRSNGSYEMAHSLATSR